MSELLYAIHLGWVDVMLHLAALCRMSYRDANALLFFVLWPTTTLGLVGAALWQRRMLAGLGLKNRTLFDHLSLGTTNLARAMSFYDAVLHPLGIERVWTTEDAAGYGYAGGEDCFSIMARPGFATPGAGFHIAFKARTRVEVHVFYRAALARGGSNRGAPGLRPKYGDGYFAAFIADPDGHHLEAVCHEGQAER